MPVHYILLCFFFLSLLVLVFLLPPSVSSLLWVVIVGIRSAGPASGSDALYHDFISLYACMHYIYFICTNFSTFNCTVPFFFCHRKWIKLQQSWCTRHTFDKRNLGTNIPNKCLYQLRFRNNQIKLQLAWYIHAISLNNTNQNIAFPSQLHFENYQS